VKPGMQMKIVDLHTGKSLPANQEGEICFRGPTIFWGYLDNEEATREVKDPDGWYHMGDVGYYDECDRLFVTDRIKEMIKYESYTIAPCEIENVLLKHEAVMAAVVVGVDHPRDVKWLRAYVELRKNKQATEQELKDFVAANLAPYKQLRAGVRFVDKMPLSELGKIERLYFRKLVKDEVIKE